MPLNIRNSLKDQEVNSRWRKFQFRYEPPRALRAVINDNDQKLREGTNYEKKKNERKKHKI